MRAGAAHSDLGGPGVADLDRQPADDQPVMQAVVGVLPAPSSPVRPAAGPSDSFITLRHDPCTHYGNAAPGRTADGHHRPRRFGVADRSLDGHTDSQTNV